jgi:hypothetical protein
MFIGSRGESVCRMAAPVSSTLVFEDFSWPSGFKGDMAEGVQAVIALIHKGIKITRLSLLVSSFLN